jgi:hypothetical protein
MLKANGPASEAPNDYPTFLLREKRRDLQALKLELRRLQISPDEYLSCRLALLEAIRQLEQIAGKNRTQETNCHELRGSALTPETSGGRKRKK